MLNLNSIVQTINYHTCSSGLAGNLLRCLNTKLADDHSMVKPNLPIKSILTRLHFYSDDQLSMVEYSHLSFAALPHTVLITYAYNYC